jgi:hypothetical protein
VERNEKVLVLLLGVPLLIYFVPYSYAATTSSSYVIENQYPGTSVPAHQSGINVALCNTGDYATGSLYFIQSFDENAPPTVLAIHGANDASGGYITGGTPHGIYVDVWNPSSSGTINFWAGAICQTPIAVAGVGVPEFGSLYSAIALAAILYFALSRLKARKVIPTHPAVP